MRVDEIRTVTVRTTVSWASLVILKGEDGRILQANSDDWHTEIIGVNGEPCDPTNDVRTPRQP